MYGRLLLVGYPPDYINPIGHSWYPTIWYIRASLYSYCSCDPVWENRLIMILFTFIYCILFYLQLFIMVTLLHLLYCTKCSRVKTFIVFVVLLELQMFSHNFQSVLALMDSVLMQMQKFICKSSQSFGPWTFCTVVQ